MTRHYLIILMRHLHLALLAATAATAFSQSVPEESASVNMARQLAGKSNAQVDYPVKAYICLDDNSEVKKPAALWLGSRLQVCVKIKDSVVAENIIVEDILTFVISQPDGTATDWETITNAVAVPMTDKVCHESGICNIKSHLLPKFFTYTNPGDLRVDGVAILAIRNAPLVSSSASTVEGIIPAVRRLRVPIRGLLTGEDVKAFMTAQQQQINNRADDKETAIVSAFADSAQRMLQDGTTLSDFALEVGLKGDGSSGGSNLRDAVVVVAMVVAGCCVFVWLCVESSRQDEKKDITRFNSNTTNIQSTFRNNGTAQAKMPSPGHHTRTLERTSKSQLLSTEENGTTDPDQQSAEPIIDPPTNPKVTSKERGRSRLVEREEVTRRHRSTAKNHSSNGNNDSAARAKMPSSSHHTRTLERTSTSRPLSTEENGTTDPDQQSADQPTNNPTEQRGTPKINSSLGKPDSGAQAKMPSSESRRREEQEEITRHTSSTAKNHSSLGDNDNDNAARAKMPSSAAKVDRRSLLLAEDSASTLDSASTQLDEEATNEALQREISLRNELKAFFQEKELTTTMHCHTFFTQHFAHQDNIKIMSYSTFIAFMKETRTKPLRKRHKQQLQMLLANHAETQRTSNCASLPTENQQSVDFPTNSKDTSKKSGTAKIDSSLESNDNVARAKMPSSDQQPNPKAPKVSKSSSKASKSPKAPTAPKAPKAPKPPKTPKSSKSPNGPEAPMAPKAPKTPKTAQKTPKGPKTPKTLRKIAARHNV
jgi:hypothetical protein